MKSEILEILVKPALTSKDIATVESIGQRQARNIMKQCRDKFDGSILYRPNAITADSYFRYCGTTREDYLKGIGGNQ